eukprot:g2054.t1
MSTSTKVDESTPTTTANGGIPSAYAKLKSIAISNGIEKSSNDKRVYKTITLKNELQVLLISDPETDKAAAALDVHVGHFSDPEDLPGLAHFLEHMLFLGTKKYPNENMYSNFLNENGGSSNAYTACHHTNYQFDVTPPHLEKTLDMFAEFFISPLFTATATDRELKAVDSENSKNLQTDTWRLFQLSKTLSKSSHPFHKFGTGNLQTLKIEPEAKGLDTRAALLKFHKDYYSANIMKLVILGKDSLETLEKWAIEKFSPIPNFNIKAPTCESDPFGDAVIGRQLVVEPVKDLRYLRLMFQMPSQHAFYESKPASFWSHLIGHESAGSILSLLKKKGWANELMAGISTSEDSFATYDVTIELTEEGLSHVHEATLVVFQYIAMLREDGLQQWVQDENAEISAINVKFMPRARPFGYVTRLAKSMHLYPASRCLLGSYVVRAFDRKLTEQMLALLRPDNMCLLVVSKAAFAKATGGDDSKCSTEKWYSTKYVSAKIDADSLKFWATPPKNDALFMPERNKFVASDLSILSDGESSAKDAPPRLVKEDALCRVWYKKDMTYKTPKLNALLRLTMPAVMEGVESQVNANLFKRLLMDELNEYSYYAVCAGLAYNLEQTSSGLNLKFGGYNDKMVDLAKHVVAKIVNFKVKPDRFHVIRDKYRLELKNFEMEQPYQHALYHSQMCLQTETYYYKQKLEAVSASTPKDLTNFAARMMNKVFVEGLLHGNVSESKAIKFVDEIVEVLKPRALFPSDHAGERYVKLCDGGVYQIERAEVNPNQPCSAIDMVYQVGMETNSMREHALLKLCAQIIKEPFYDVLRTKEQLGYLVFSGSGERRGVMYFRFIIQSDKASATYLEKRIYSFLETFRGDLVELKSDAFEATKDAVVANLLEKPKTLAEETTRHWNAITSRQYIFDSRKLTAAEVRKIALGDVVAFYDKYVASKGDSRSVFVSKMIGNRMQETIPDPKETEDKTKVEIEDFHTFIRGMPMFPVRAYVPSKFSSGPSKL